MRPNKGMRPQLVMFILLALLLAGADGCNRRNDGSAGRSGDLSELAGDWTGWGRVTWASDGTGTYTDTYGTGPGTMQLRRSGDRTYEGTWRESAARHGTMVMSLSADGSQLTGTWSPDPDCTIGTRQGGTLTLRRRRGACGPGRPVVLDGAKHDGERRWSLGLAERRPCWPR